MSPQNDGQLPRVPRRRAVLGLLGATAVGLPGATRTVGATRRHSGVSVAFAGPRVARIESASALTSLTLYYLDARGERAAKTVDSPARSGRWGPLQLRYAKGNDTAVVKVLGRGDALVRVVGDISGGEVGATNRHLDGVLGTFNAAPTASLAVSTSTPEVGETVTFTSTADDPDLPADRLEYGWDLDGDGTFETIGREVTSTYDSVREVTVTHRVTDDFGATDTARRTVSPRPDEYEQLAKLTAPDPVSYAVFGISVDVSGDTVVIGAEADDGGAEASGAAYAFVRSGEEWVVEANLTAPDPTAWGGFGTSVAISGDTAVIGTESRSAHVFVRSDGEWRHEAELVVDGGEAGDVAVSGDTAVVGAEADDSGAAYAFVRSDGGWTREAKLVADATELRDVAVSGDTTVVGTAGDGGGAARVFVRSDGEWTREARLADAVDIDTYDSFGNSVAVAGDTAVVGASGDDGADSQTGAAYVFARTDGTWALEAKLGDDDVVAYDYFGSSVAVSGDTVAVGTPFDSGEMYVGSTHVFTRTDGTWVLEAKLTSDIVGMETAFGGSVAVDGDMIVAGAPFSIVNHVYAAGAAYVFGR